MTGSVFPVGHYSGIRPGNTPDSHLVRIGWRQHRLSEDGFGIWVLAHGVAGTGKGVWSAEQIVAKAEEAGLAEAKVLLDELVALGLLALVPVPDSPDRMAAAVAFARGYKMEILYVGLGNTPDRPEEHAVGIPGIGTAAVLDQDCYELWQWGSLAPTLWHSCEVRAAVFGELARTLDPAAALRQILGDLRYLIVHGCAYLDIAAAG